MNHDLATRRRRLRYRSTHTGMRENDILLGGFVTEQEAALDEQAVQALEHLMAQATDPEINGWITGKDPVPGAFATPIMACLQRYVTGRKRP
jgi:antitoxin CptB